MNTLAKHVPINIGVKNDYRRVFDEALLAETT